MMASDPPSSEPRLTPVPAETAKQSAPAWRAWVISGIVAAVVAVGAGYFVTRSGGSDAVSTNAGSGDATGGSTATSGPNGFGGFARLGASGEITAIDGETLTIASTDPQSGATTNVDVATTGDTTFTETVEGELGDIAVGDNVLVVAGDDGTSATALIDNGDDVTGGFGFGQPGGNGGTPPSFPEGTPPTLADGSQPSLPPGGAGGGFPGGGQGGPGSFTAGTVTAIGADTVTIENVDGTSTTLTVGDETTVTVTREINLEDLAVGDTITATPADLSDTTDDGAVTAGMVRRGDGLGIGGFGGPGGFGPPASGDTSG